MRSSASFVSGGDFENFSEEVNLSMGLVTGQILDYSFAGAESTVEAIPLFVIRERVKSKSS